MSKSKEIAYTLIEEGVKARAHFQVWWALCNIGIEKYYKTMNEPAYIDFFHAAHSGHFTLFLLSLAKIFDSDSRVASLKKFKETLCAEGMNKSSLAIEQALKPHKETVKRVIAIRNKSVAHNDHGITRKEVYDLNGVTPNELRELIDVTCTAINEAARELSINNTIFENDRGELSTLNMLEALSKGLQNANRTSKRSVGS